MNNEMSFNEVYALARLTLEHLIDEYVIFGQSGTPTKFKDGVPLEFKDIWYKSYDWKLISDVTGIILDNDNSYVACQEVLKSLGTDYKGIFTELMKGNMKSSFTDIDTIISEVVSTRIHGGSEAFYKRAVQVIADSLFFGIVNTCINLSDEVLTEV